MDILNLTASTECAPNCSLGVNHVRDKLQLSIFIIRRVYYIENRGHSYRKKFLDDATNRWNRFVQIFVQSATKKEETNELI